MAKEYLWALISAPAKKEAGRTLELLLKDKLIAGGMISEGWSNYWWEGKINKKIYYNVSIFTVLENKNKIIEIVEKISSDEAPGAVFFKIDHGNRKFLDWIDKNTR